MKCPNCNETLLMTVRQNVEIDYCPTCRGIWLDKGELDKLLEYSVQNTEGNNFRKQTFDNERVPYQEGYERNDKYSDRNSYPQQHGRKKKSFLSDLFDFD
ncbi:TFIIB-type zinc ribbon-containing protein [Sphingobacterium rhinopitheci]|uniref:TFIIB-type zinc ribbon-containing protein n=1 Tax=Sphingobacterium rhinopitheci TaxID=2781960 RepID=UPI001F51C222|nr:zf-TFIIB domain-containing protein [Sphingobacterium rhinopitheci]MCI0922238.1 zf-TFIIB domain-containing protein [Sphingobacterium rhinopitheci]